MAAQVANGGTGGGNTAFKVRFGTLSYENID
jgi:hypothetical protein